MVESAEWVLLADLASELRSHPTTLFHLLTAEGVASRRLGRKGRAVLRADVPRIARRLTEWQQKTMRASASAGGA